MSATEQNWRIERMPIAGYKVTRLKHGREIDKRYVYQIGWTKAEMVTFAKQEMLDPCAVLDPLGNPLCPDAATIARLFP